MELRIPKVEKGGAARVTNTREAGPFGKHRGLVILVRSVSLSNWRLLVAYGPDLRVTKVWLFDKLRGLVFLVRSVSLSNWPLLVAQGPVKSRQSGIWRSRGKIMFPPITVILCESRESRNTSSKEKTDPSSAVLTLTHISFRAGCVSDGCTHSFIRN